jgi:hypothetical protein
MNIYSIINFGSLSCFKLYTGIDKMFNKIDDFLLDKIFQPISDWFVDHYGRGPMWLAATCGYAYCISAMGIIVYSQNKTSLFNFGLMLLATAKFFESVKLDELDKKTVYNTSRTRNEKRITCKSFRKINLFIAVMFILFTMALAFSPRKISGDDVFWLLWVLSIFLKEYFESCDSRPPRPIKKLVESLA